ncbi:hypothetical protein [Arthrobacter sp. ISL-48]|uniref:hypothetical protein n=1 Tax=Arthrobacter sp. ISL-48 TaxID=2819110 RepID=UPI00203577E8|nr:hypothetical protein [Arthrobacter sp. ISL-48]
MKLILIGYWDGPQTGRSWPSPEQFVDASWDTEERDFVAYYLQMGLITRSYMGFSRCRFCGKENGNLELSDGHFVWPDGLAHYVVEHAVRLPDRFVRHAFAKIDGLESAARDLEWWRGISSANKH